MQPLRRFVCGVCVRAIAGRLSCPSCAARPRARDDGLPARIRSPLLLGIVGLFAPVVLPVPVALTWDARVVAREGGYSLRAERWLLFARTWARVVALLWAALVGAALIGVAAFFLSGG